MTDAKFKLEDILNKKKAPPQVRSCNSTDISSEIGTKLRDWAVWQARACCYSQAALFSNDSKTLYYIPGF